MGRLAWDLRRQYNLVTRPQAIAALGEDAVDARVQRGDLEVVHRAVYRPPHMPVPEEQRAMASVLRCRPHAWVTGEALLGLFRIEGFSPASALRVLVPPQRSVSNVPFTVLLDPYSTHHRATVRKVPAVTVGRGLADAALFIGDKQLRAGVDSAKWRGLITNERLRATMEALPGHAGAERIQGHLASGTFDAESEGERGLAPIVAGFVPAPEHQVEVLPGIRVDFAWLVVRLALEYDGRDNHDRDRDRDHDEARSLEIKRAGWEHLRVRHPMLARPAELAASIAEIYNLRAEHLGVPPLASTGF